MIEFTSVSGLGGGFELGAVRTGDLELKYRTGSLSLGAPIVEANRNVIGWTWTSDFTDDYRDWARPSSPVFICNPPCSAWSTQTRKDLRGAGAKVLKCTTEIIQYAGLQQTPPLIIAIESVQQAFSTGREYYQQLRMILEEVTGERYDLIWVFQSNVSLGGASVRRRCFIIYTRIPFGTEYAQPSRVARLGDAIRDLSGLQRTMQQQSYRRPPSWWSVPLRSSEGVDGMSSPDKANREYTHLLDVMSSHGIPWPVGTTTTHALRMLYKKTGEVPEPWDRIAEKLIAKDFDLGFNQTMRWNPDGLGRVVTGQGPLHSVHYAEHRLFTYRECARIQGFPDTWRIWPVRDYTHVGAVWGKGVPVDAGRWIAQWVVRAVNGNPGTVRGEYIGERERKSDVTQSYKRTLDMERRWEHQDHVLHTHKPWWREAV